MAYTETKTTGYGSRIKNSLVRTIIGIGIFVFATIMLFNNEGDSVKAIKTLIEVQDNVQLVDDVSQVDSGFNNKLIHAMAFANTNDTVQDPLFKISATAIKLLRNVSFYQYKERCRDETHEHLGGSETTTTICTYKPIWSDELIDSSEFKDTKYINKNVVLLNIKSEIIQAKNVSFGAYHLPSFLIKKIKNNENVEVNLNDKVIQQLEASVLETFYTLNPQKKVIRKWPVINPNENYGAYDDEIKVIHVNNGIIYIGENPNNPRIGDIKISFEKTLPTDVSIIAKVVNSSFGRYLSKSGREFARLEVGEVPFDNMLQHARAEDSTKTWIIRVVGLLLLCIAINAMFSILPMLLKWWPFLGSIVGVGVGMVCTIGALLWGLLVIATAWLFYRPIIAVSLIVFAIFGIFYLRKKADKHD